MPSDSSTPKGRWHDRLTLPPPDSREGAAVATGAIFALVYIVVLVSAYDAMTSPLFAFDVTAVSLIVSLVSAFALSGMLGADIATFQRLELELARTVLAYVGSGTPPPSDAPLAGVWRAHVAAAEESRRMARAHAYGLGLFTAAGVLSLAAVLLSALGGVGGSRDVVGLGMFVEWFAFLFLASGAAVVLASIGYASPVPFYDGFAPRRWRRNAGRQQAVDGAVSEIGWLSEYSRGARESRISPAGPSMIPSWHE
jgi:hypothetical protein